MEAESYKSMFFEVEKRINVKIRGDIKSRLAIKLEEDTLGKLPRWPKTTSGIVRGW